MRTIKFRGQNISGHWNYGLLCNDKNKDSDYEWFISNSAGKPYAFGCLEKTIGQFTGLLDKNSREIYEGDVVRCFGRIYSIVYDNGSFHLSGKNIFTYPLRGYLGENGQLEVIGNIHTTPELLNN